MIYSRINGMKQRLRVAAPIVGGIAALLLNSCAPLPHDPKEKFILVTANTKVAYWQAALKGMAKACDELKVKYELTGPETYDTKAEHDEFQRAVGQKPSGILISSADASLMGPDINSALERGIPVITVDSDAPASKRMVFVGTDNYNAGVLGGQLAAKLLNGKGNVVVFTMPNQNNLNDRLHGYQSAFEAHPGIKITDIVDIKGDPTVAFDTATKMINAKAKVDAFVCLEAVACPEVGEVVSRSNMGGKISIVAMDTDQRTLTLIQKGVISATIAQKPFTMAYFGVKLLDDIHHHPPATLGSQAENPYSPLPTFVDTGTTIVDKNNLASFQQAESK